MKIFLVAGCMAAAAACAGLVEETRSRPVLAARVELAPFGDLAKKVASFGSTIGNPLVPTLVLGGAQETLVKRYGQMRTDGPIVWHVYVQTPAWDVAATNDNQESAAALCDVALVYPAVDGPATMRLNHPGSSLSPDGTLHLLAGEGRPDDLWVRFTDDRRFCAFATSPALAARALADFAQTRSRPAAETPPLVRAEVTPRGLSAAAALLRAAAASAQARRQVDALLKWSALALTADVDDAGLALATRATPAPGKTPRPAAALPPGALDAAPAEAPLFVSLNEAAAAAFDGATSRETMDAFAAALQDLSAACATNAPSPRLAPFLAEAAAATKTLARDMPDPAPADWSTLALGFDASQRPCLLAVGEQAQADRARAAGAAWTDALAAAAARHWPGRALLARKPPLAYDLDLAALLDVAAQETPDDADARRALHAAKDFFAKLLGGATLEVVSQAQGPRTSTRFSAPGVRLSGPPSGEARLAAALPETRADRPSHAFYFALYALLRDHLLPLVAAHAEKPADAQRIRAMVAGMPPLLPNSALAGAGWLRKDGSWQGLLRVTANELKSYGAAFNAFTAASLAAERNAPAPAAKDKKDVQKGR